MTHLYPPHSTFKLLPQTPYHFAVIKPRYQSSYSQPSSLFTIHSSLCPHHNITFTTYLTINNPYPLTMGSQDCTSIKQAPHLLPEVVGPARLNLNLKNYFVLITSDSLLSSMHISKYYIIDL